MSAQEMKRRSFFAGLAGIWASAGPAARRLSALPARQNPVRRPLIVTSKTNPYVKEAVTTAAWETLQKGGTALDAAEKAVNVAELDPRDPSVRESLIGILGSGDDDEEVRRLAAGALRGTAAEPDALGALLGVLGDRDAPPLVRGAAGAALAGAGPALAPSLPALIAILEASGEEAAVANGAAAAIGSLGPRAEAALPALRKARQVFPGSFEIEAALRRIEPREVPVERFAEHLLSGRIDAAPLIADAGPEAARAAPVLLRAVTAPWKSWDDRRGPRRKAIDLLPGLGPGAVPCYVDLLCSADCDFRARAAEVLGKMGPAGAAAIPALLAALDDPDDEVRREVARALGKMKETP